MKLLIVGNNPQNGRIARYFEERGVNALVQDDPAALARLDGQWGAFAARLPGEAAEVDFVLLTEIPGEGPGEVGGGQPLPLYLDNKAAALSRKKRTAPVAFLLDWFCESSPAATLRALADAMALAKLKRRVYYFDKFVRTAPRGGEMLYRDARNAGVIFVKYEALDIRYGEDTDTFHMHATDGVLDTTIEAQTLFADGGRAPGAAFEGLAKRLNLRGDAQGYLTEDRYFLAPVFTSRRGVYALPRDAAAEDLDGMLATVLAAMAAQQCAEEPGKSSAQVDGEKCVLCYSCHRACPHAAMAPDTAARKMDNLERACEGCGICVSVCPGNAIVLSGDAAAPRLADKSDKALLLCCENSAALAADKALPAMGALAAQVELQAIPCGGRVGFEELSGALRDYGRVMVAVCMDDACKHMDGNKRACLQTGRFEEMAAAAGIDAGRVAYTQVSCAMPLVLRDELSAFLRGDNA